VVVINSQRINREIKTTLARYDEKSSQVNHIEFIIERFFHYFTLAVMHGIQVSVPKLFSFDLVYEYLQSVPRRLKKSVFFSSKAFGYSFFFRAESKQMDYHGYIYRTDKELLKKIANHNESDIIYQLLKK
jgi:hypothetical protein